MATPDNIIQILLHTDVSRAKVLELANDPECASIIDRTVHARQILSYWYDYLTIKNLRGWSEGLRRIYIDLTRISVRDEDGRERTDQWKPARIEIKLSKTERYEIPVKIFNLAQCELVEKVYQSMRGREVNHYIISGTKEKIINLPWQCARTSKVIQEPRKERIVYAIGERRSYFKDWDGQASGFTTNLPKVDKAE